MPNSFNGYCYATLSEAANAEIATPAQTYSTGIAAANSWGPVSGNVVNLQYVFKPFSSTAASSVLLNRTYPPCPTVGYLTNYSGLELADVIEVSWGVILVWVLAYTIKSLRRAL